MHVRRRLLLVQDIRGKQKRLSLYIFVVIRVILIIRLKYISQILPCIPYVLYISYIIVQLFVFLLTNCRIRLCDNWFREEEEEEEKRLFSTEYVS